MIKKMVEIWKAMKNQDAKSTELVFVGEQELSAREVLRAALYNASLSNSHN